MPGYGAKYWAERTSQSRRRSYPRLKGNHTADAVVIGGGLTGAMAAYALAATGLDVMVVEAERVAEGATAASPGIIVPEPDAWFREVEPLTGKRATRLAWKGARRGAAELATAIRRLGIKCDLMPAKCLLVSESADGAAVLRKEQAARRVEGLTASWLPAQAIRAETALESSGGLGIGDGFTFDPVRATLGFMAAAQDKGARVFERSAVRRTTFTRKNATAVLKDATITTGTVVVATGEPGQAFGQLRRHMRRNLGYAVVTEPLSAAMRREAGRRASIVADARTGGERHWLRWLPDDRALFAGAVSALLPTRQRDRAIVQRTAQLMYEFSLKYPVISGLPARWGWNAEVVSTVDGLPWIGSHRNYPFHFFSMGFGWHGDGLAWLAARMAVRSATGELTRDDEALGFSRYLG